MKLGSFFACVILFLSTNFLRAQYYNTGQDPGSLKWMQIKTDHFRVIYPSTFGHAGIDFTRSLEEAWPRLSPLYPAKRSSIPIIIHNHTIGSNGYVAWAPSRMELYPTPEQNSIPLAHDTQLAIHELTHVLQMQSLNRGFSKGLSFFLGEQFTGFTASLLPLWYLEGDAVFSETIFTGSGRGRNASFQKPLKALMLEKGNVYGYDKSVNGSFRDYVPDHYQYGYQMMAYSYLKYGRQLWQDALQTTGNAPYLGNPVNYSLKKNASLSKKKLFRETYDSLRIIWENDDLSSGAEYYEIVNPPKGRHYINYHSPVFSGNDTIVAIRTSLSEPPAIVMIIPSLKQEIKLHIPGNSYPWFISIGNNLLCWVEARSDPRWANREWSVIMTMDLMNNKVRQLSSKTRYMAASISPDGNFIAAVENTPDNHNRLVFIDSRTGSILESVPSPGDVPLQRPQWSDNGEKITVIYLTEQGEGIMTYTRGEKQWQQLVEPGFDDLQSSFLRNDSLFYVSSRSGTDNIYLRKPDGTDILLTRSRFGAGSLNLHGNRIIFTDYTSYGNNICVTTTGSPANKSRLFPAAATYLIETTAQQVPRFPPETQRNYSPEPYRKWQNLFRFHSWMPFYADIDRVKDDLSSLKPGLTILSQNNLSTLESSFGYEYSDNRHKIHSKLSWLGWYLIFESRVDYGDLPRIEKFGTSVGDPPGVYSNFKITNSVSLPLSFKGGPFTQLIFLSASTSYKNDKIYLKDRQVYDLGQNQVSGRLYFMNYRKPAFRDIYPGWAQVIDINYSHYPFDREIYGNILSARTAFHFPGLLKNNTLRLKIETERQSRGLYVYNSRISFPRGYRDIISPHLWFASADYHMPLVYPDFNIGSLVYITRIRSDFFIDYARANTYYKYTYSETGRSSEFFNQARSFNSYGIGLLSDFYVFRMPFMISAGVQASWKEAGRLPVMAMLFSINLYGMSIGKERL